MLRTAIALILFLIAAVWLGIALGQDPGLALFSWRDTSVEMPLWFAACCLLLMVFLVWHLSHWVHALPEALHRLKIWRNTRRLHRHVCHIRDGLLDLVAQRWQKAEKHLAKAGSETDLHPLDSLGAAYAAHQLGALKRRDAWLAQAGNTPAARLLQADFCLDDGRPQDTIALLAAHRKDPAALIRLQKAYRRLEKWDELFEIIPALRKSAVISEEKAARMERNTVKNWLASADNTDVLQQVWQQLPRHLRHDPRLVRLYVTHLLHFPDTADKALPLITSGLARQFDPALVRLYGHIVLPDSKKQLSTAEKWLKHHPQDPALLLTLGRIALRCRLWGKARGYLNECLESGKKNTDALALLGLLDEQAGDIRAALAHYRAGLRITGGTDLTE